MWVGHIFQIFFPRTQLWQKIPTESWVQAIILQCKNTKEQQQILLPLKKKRSRLFPLDHHKNQIVGSLIPLSTAMTFWMTKDLAPVLLTQSPRLPILETWTLLSCLEPPVSYPRSFLLALQISQPGTRGKPSHEKRDQHLCFHCLNSVIPLLALTEIS